MAENDIYNSQGKYEGFKKKLDLLTLTPDKRKWGGKYYCKNKANLGYFRQLFRAF